MHATKQKHARLLGMSLWMVGLLAGGVLACGDLLVVNDPDIVQPEDLNTPAGLEVRRAGAFGDFARAYAGDASQSDHGEGQILTSGLFADEFKKTGTDPARYEVDARRIQAANGQMSDYYAALHRARRAAESTADVFQESGVAEDEDKVVAEMSSLAGFTYIFFGENYCSGVPFSRLTATGDIEYGEPLNTGEIFGRSLERFDEGVSRAQSAGNTELEHLARVGKARTLLNLGRFGEAASLVESVPTDFRYEINYSTNIRRQENGVYNANVLLERWSVVNNEGGGINFLEAFDQGDPRTPYVVAPDSTGFSPGTGIMYYQQIYTDRAAPIPLATGTEARLVEAEAALQAGNAGEFQSIHNALRATLNDPDVGPILSDTMSAEEQVDFHFRERALWMWLTGHRMGDMRRLVRQYDRNPETVFPTGEYPRPQFTTYGDDVNFPVPFEETNNPNFESCIDRNA